MRRRCWPSDESAVDVHIIRTADIRPASAPKGRQSRKNGRLIAAGTAATSVADRPASVRIHWAATTCIHTPTALASWMTSRSRKRANRSATRGDIDAAGAVAGPMAPVLAAAGVGELEGRGPGHGCLLLR